MRVLIVGGGPGGLHLGALLKKADPRCHVTIVERRAAGQTFGFGVLCAEDTLANLAASDPVTHDQIEREVVRTTEIEVRYLDTRAVVGECSFAGISRPRLLQILRRRCESLGCELMYGQRLDGDSSFERYELVVAADGARSGVRSRLSAQFGTEIRYHSWKYLWLGVDYALERFTFSFRDGGAGVFHIHGYRHQAGASTVVVECDQEAWRRAGLDRADEAASVAYCSTLFGDDLGGRALTGNRSRWDSFALVSNERWYHSRVVLLGDAAHTAHFSTGTGTKAALEDAISLAAQVSAWGPTERAFEAYQAERVPLVRQYQEAGDASREWFEDVRRGLRFLGIAGKGARGGDAR
ncbi:MAG: FAD-dependent monooxygenase [Chloroflexota bacterium]